jgi:hypothetical protein
MVSNETERTRVMSVEVAMNLELGNLKLFVGVAVSIACNAACGGLKPISDNPDAADQHSLTAAQWARTTLTPTTPMTYW